MLNDAAPIVQTPAETPISRDTEYEAAFLENVVEEAARRFGIDVSYFAHQVQARLKLGAERYGDDDFRRKDVVSELFEETPDVCAYVLLEAQKRLSEPLEDEGRDHFLFECAVHAAAADWNARQAR
jgi:hypothetical protein